MQKAAEGTADTSEFTGLIGGANACDLRGVGLAMQKAMGMNMKSDARKYRPDIDGIRTIAVLSVVLFHAGLAFIPGGFVGVDVFFVISGYLIGGHIFSEVDGQNFSFVDFYVRRCKRILPALFFVLLATYILAFLLLMPEEVKAFSRSAIATILASSNILFYLSANYFSPNSDQLPLLMTWSLGVEEQFYIAFPVIIIATMKFFPKKISAILMAMSLISLIWSIHCVHNNVSAAFYLLPSRAWELGIGSLLAIRELRYGKLLGQGLSSELASMLGIGLIGLAILTYTAATPFPGEFALLPAIGAALLIMGEVSWINRRMLGSLPFVAIGKISYSLYLWHWPLLSFARIASDRVLPVRSALLLVLLAMAMATISYYWIEQPFRRYKGRKINILVSYALVILLMLAPPAVIAKLHGIPMRYDDNVRRLQTAQQTFMAEPCIVGYGISAIDQSIVCLPQGPRPHSVALLGDSHANALAPGMRVLANEQGKAFFTLTKASCPPLFGVSRYMSGHPSHSEECKAYQAAALAYIRQHREIDTVVLAGYWNAPFHDRSAGFVSRYVTNPPGSDRANDALLRQGLTDEIRALRSMGRNVVVMADVPFLAFDPIRRFAQDHIPLRGALARSLQSDNRVRIEDDKTRELVAEVAAAERMRLVDPYSVLCDARGCQDRANGEVLYMDPQHLSPSGALLVARLVNFN